jgi:ABC-type Mn2+/Zn2+ transport system permease subunit
MTFKDAAGIALAILWGGALCLLGYYAVLSLMAALSMAVGTRDKRTQDDAGIGIIVIPTFVALLLYTLSVADLFHFIDWTKHRT